MNRVTINGVTYAFTGASVSIQNGKIIVDGQDLTPDSKQIDIAIEGNVTKVEVGACQTMRILGDVGSVSTQSGDVDVSGNVLGSIQTMSGDVECKNVGGSVSSVSGKIKHGG